VAKAQGERHGRRTFHEVISAIEASVADDLEIEVALGATTNETA